MMGDVLPMVGDLPSVNGPSSGVKSRSAAASVIAVLKDLTAVRSP